MDRSSSPPWSHFFSQLSLAPEWIDYYSRSFTENSMQLEMIPDLQPDYMSYLGISKLGHFMIIKKLAKELLSPLAPPPTFTRPPCNLSSSSYSLKQSDTALHINIHDKHTDNTVIIDSQQSQIKEHIIESITNITALNNLSPPSTTPNSPPSLHQDTVESIQDPVDTIPTPPRDLTSSPLTLNPHEQVVSSFQQSVDSHDSSPDRELDIQPYTETVYATTNTVCKIKSNKPVPDKKTRRKTCASSQPSFQKKRRNTKKKKPTPVTSQSIPTQLPYTLPVSIRLPIALLESIKSTEQPIELHEIPISTKSTEQPIELHEIPISTKSTEQPIELHEIPISTKSTEQPIELHEIPISTKSTEQPIELLESTRLPNMSHTLHSNSPIIHMSEEISCIINEDLVDTDIEQDRTLSQPHDLSSPGVFVFHSQTTRPIISSSSYLTNTCTLPVNDNIIPGKSSPILSIERIDISQFTPVKNNVASMVTSSPSEFLIDLSELPDSDDGIPSQLNNSIPPKHIDTTPSEMDLPIPTTQHNGPIQINTNSIEQSTIQNVNSVLNNSQENISTDPVDLVLNTIPATTEHSVTSSPDISIIDNPDITDTVHTSTNSSPSITPLLNGLNTFSNSTNTLTNSALGKTITTSSHFKRKLTSTRRKDSKRLKTKPPSVVIRQIGHELFEDSISSVKLPPTFILPKKSNLIQSKLSDITRLSRTKKNIPINIEVSYVSDIHSQDVNHDTNIQCVDNLLDLHTSNSLPSSSKEIPVSDSEIDNIPSSPLSLHGESDKDDNALIQTHLISNPVGPNINVPPHIQQVSRDEINPIISIPNPSETGNDISIPPDSTVIAQRIESSNTQEYLTKFAIALGENPDFFIQDKLKSKLISPRKKSKLQKKRKTKLQTVYKQKHKHKPNRLTPQKRGVRAKLRSRRVRIGVNKQIGPVMVRAVLKDKVTLPSVTSKRYVRPLPDIPFDTRGKSTSPENSDDDLVTRKKHTIAHVKKRYRNFYNTIYPQIRSEEITQPPIKGNTDYAKPQPGVQLSLKDTLIYARQERRNFACHNCLLCFETPYQLLQHSMLPKCDEIPTYYPEY